MTTEQIRKLIHITEYDLTEKGIKIEYVRWSDRDDELGTKKTLWYTPTETAKLLSIIGSIDLWERDPFRLRYSVYGVSINDTWFGFCESFTFSQYEALTLAIRHEMELEADKDIQQSDLGKSINKILK
jgi:hypothetical protein